MLPPPSPAATAQEAAQFTISHAPLLAVPHTEPPGDLLPAVLRNVSLVAAFGSFATRKGQKECSSRTGNARARASSGVGVGTNATIGVGMAVGVQLAAQLTVIHARAAWHMPVVARPGQNACWSCGAAVLLTGVCVAGAPRAGGS